MKKLLSILICTFALNLFAGPEGQKSFIQHINNKVHKKAVELCNNNNCRYYQIDSLEVSGENGFSFNCKNNEKFAKEVRGNLVLKGPNRDEIDVGYSLKLYQKKPSTLCVDARVATLVKHLPHFAGLKTPGVSIVEAESPLDLQQEIGLSNSPVLVLFYDDSLQNCRDIIPYFEQMFYTHSTEFTFLKMDINNSAWLKKRYIISSTPALVTLDRNGKHRKTYKGLTSIVTFFNDGEDKYKLISE